MAGHAAFVADLAGLIEVAAVGGGAVAGDVTLYHEAAVSCTPESQFAAHIVAVGVEKTHKLAAGIALDGHSLAIASVMVGASAFVACGWTTAAEGSTSSTCCYSALIPTTETTRTGIIATGSEAATAHGGGGSALEVGGVVHAETLRGEVWGQ